MTTYGADTSHWKWTPGIDFGRMKASGRCDYLIAKATEGVGYIDPSYAGWRAGAKSSGMLFGSFGFARPGDPVAQADYYLAAARPVAGEIPVLDLEDLAIPDAGNFGAAYCQRVQQKTGTLPLLYTYPDFIRTRDLSPIQRLGVKLWFADYNDPLNPMGPWPSYVIRQFTSSGSLPGLPATNVDLNSSPLTLDQLRGLSIGAQEDDVIDQATIDAIATASAKATWEQVLSGVGSTKLDSPISAERVLVEARQIGSGVGKAVAALAAKDPAQVTAADIAAAIPADLAAQVIDALAQRLSPPAGS